MTTTTQQYQQPLQNGLQYGLHDSNNVQDQTQQIPADFCRALYDYQSRDASSLSFRKGDIIEVLTQLDSGWWDGLLNDERGWFPSNYVAPISVQEIEQEMRAARGADTQDTDWMRESGQSINGPSSDSWVPRISNSGRVFFVNTQTGEHSTELPNEGDSDTEPLSISSNSTVTLAPSTYSTSSSITAVAPESPSAGFGIPRPSGTPEPWVKRLADDGMSYYYLNPFDGAIRWTVPSPQPSQEAFSFPDRRQQADSSAGRLNRISVYSDDSDVNPLGILGRTAAHGHSTAPLAATSIPENLQEDEPDVQAAKDLQSALEGQFSSIPNSLDDLAQIARTAITDLLDAALIRSNSALAKEAIKRTTDAVRNIVYASSSLIGPLTSLPSPYTESYGPSDQAELKGYHRKVTATMVKLVSTIRASLTDVVNADTTVRFENDAAELERAISAFVNEVIRRRGPEGSAKHVHAVLRSAEGHKGIGLEVHGAGAGGNWRGFGFVQPVRGQYLSSDLLTAVKEQKSKVDDILTQLMPTLSQGDAAEVFSLGQEAIGYLCSFLGYVGEINIARMVDLDTAAPDAAYLESVGRAKEHVRALEFSVEAAFEDGAVLLNYIQSIILNTEVEEEIRPWSILVTAIPALRINLDGVCSHIEALLEVAEFQADACLKSGIDTAIGLRDASRFNNSYGDTSRGAIEYQMQQLDHVSKSDIDKPREMDDNGLVDLDDAFGGRPRRGDRERDFGDVIAANNVVRDRAGTIGSYNSNGVGVGPQSDTVTGSIDGETLPGESDSGLLTTDATTDATPTVQDLSSPEDDEFDEEFGPGPNVRSPERGAKLLKILGNDTPLEYINNVSAEASKPWYLRPDYGPNDLLVTPEGNVRGGTLAALIEKLTAQDNRKPAFKSTFLLTLKSFTTLDELFDGLVKRFYMQPPDGLTPTELEDWTAKKLRVVRILVINVLKQIVTDDDVLEKEDLYILDRIKDFAAIVDKEIDPPIPAVKYLLESIEKARIGDSLVKKTPVAPSFPPAPIVPKTNKALKLLDIEPLELARQLTIMESKLFTKIRAMECLNRGKDGKPGDYDDNISAIIDTSNKVAEWVADAVLSKDDSKKRAAIVKQFINVADRCRLLQNFSTMAALVAGLNSPPIRRLKRTWEQVNARSKAQLQEAERTMDTNKNFTNYRAILKAAQLPCVPFFGVYLTVLTFTQDGNKNMIQGDVINFQKRERFAQLVREIKHYQSKPYNLAVVPAIQNFIDESLSALGNTADLSDRAWNLSLQREPREREDEKMARLLQESGFL